jgi:hypothetical protein
LFRSRSVLTCGASETKFFHARNDSFKLLISCITFNKTVGDILIAWAEQYCLITRRWLLWLYRRVWRPLGLGPNGLTDTYAPQVELCSAKTTLNKEFDVFGHCNYVQRNKKSQQVTLTELFIKICEFWILRTLYKILA